MEQQGHDPREHDSHRHRSDHHPHPDAVQDQRRKLRLPQLCLRDLIRPHLLRAPLPETLPHLDIKERVTAALEVSQSWSEDVQIDIVGFRDEHRSDLPSANGAPQLAQPPGHGML